VITYTDGSSNICASQCLNKTQVNQNQVQFLIVWCFLWILWKSDQHLNESGLDNGLMNVSVVQAKISLHLSSMIV